MSRYSSVPSRSQRIRSLGDDDYEISWVVDYYYPDSRLRHPRGFRRYTDKAGAERFCKKWNLVMPESPATAQP